MSGRVGGVQSLRTRRKSDETFDTANGALLVERLKQRCEGALGLLIRRSEPVAQCVEKLHKRGGRARQKIPDQGRLCGQDRQVV
jgi:hypothetical protein